MQDANVRTAICALGLLVVLFGGCARSKPTRFYILTSSPRSELVQQEQASTGQLVIGIGPVKFPEYLDRPQIVSRTSGNRLNLAEFDRWAEPLGESFARALTENLSSLLATERVVLYPWKGGGPVDYRITMEVIRFDGPPGGEVSLIARWNLLGPEGNELAAPRRSQITASTRQPGYEALAGAMSEAVGELSREIVAAIRSHQ